MPYVLYAPLVVQYVIWSMMYCCTVYSVQVLEEDRSLFGSSFKFKRVERYFPRERCPMTDKHGVRLGFDRMVNTDNDEGYRRRQTVRVCVYLADIII